MCVKQSASRAAAATTPSCSLAGSAQLAARTPPRLVQIPRQMCSQARRQASNERWTAVAQYATVQSNGKLWRCGTLLSAARYVEDAFCEHTAQKPWLERDQCHRSGGVH